MRASECKNIDFDRAGIILHSDNIKWIITSIIGIILFISSLVYQWAIFPMQMQGMFATKSEFNELKNDFKSFRQDFNSLILTGKLKVVNTN